LVVYKIKSQINSKASETAAKLEKAPEEEARINRNRIIKMGHDDVYIVSACRTGIGAFNGQYSKIPAVTLGTTVIKHCLQRAGIVPEKVSEVIMGQVMTAGEGQNPARQAAINAGIPITATAYTINMLCGSGLKTVQLGYQAIRNGDSSIVVCGGQENMTMSQHSAYLRAGTKLGSIDLKDTMLVDGLTDAFEKIHMGNTAEFLARKYNVSREAQDKFAFESQAKASRAVTQGYFTPEIVPVAQIKPPLDIVKDEFIKHDVTFEKLSQLPTAFEKDPAKSPSVTAGNASGINDGAAAVIICNGIQVESLNLVPLSKIVAFAQTGLEPIEMGIGPISAIEKVLKIAGWTKEQVDLYEINEAYASVSLIAIQKLGLDSQKVNVAGGALALGHPLGASGTRVLVTLIYNLLRLGLNKGVASLCIGGGMGIAIAIESCAK